MVPLADGRHGWAHRLSELHVRCRLRRWCGSSTPCRAAVVPGSGRSARRPSSGASPAPADSVRRLQLGRLAARAAGRLRPQRRGAAATTRGPSTSVGTKRRRGGASSAAGRPAKRDPGGRAVWSDAPAGRAVTRDETATRTPGRPPGPGYAVPRGSVRPPVSAAVGGGYPGCSYAAGTTTPGSGARTRVLYDPFWGLRERLGRLPDATAATGTGGYGYGGYGYGGRLRWRLWRRMGTADRIRSKSTRARFA